MSGLLRYSRNFTGALHRQVRWYASPVSPAGVDDAVDKLKTETNRLSQIAKKFWDQVSVGENVQNGKLVIQLDKKPVRTPLGNHLAVDKDRKILARLLQKEWSYISHGSVKTHALPLTSLIARCIDLEAANAEGAHPDLKVKIGGNRNELSNSLLRYLDTDTILVFSPRDELEGKLRAAQDDMYLPIIGSVEKFLSQHSDKPISLQILDADLHGLRGNAQKPETLAAARKFLDSLSAWDLAIFEKTVLTTKSFICGILLLQNKASTDPAKGLQYTMEDIARAATLETIHQTERWGEVEDTHDVDKRDIRRNVHAAAIAAYKA
ncbi:hypothetical protein ZYGR_0N07270 [Zygosaccharomyces rouxii]|uniref:Protein ATP12 n=1 Tax=Zygosaccharomyces rouxii TaxID=4956 RepID=A0A1Q3A0W9_ZYGRO|nr:hypothetical protein ZYGR_0N07270 [Zygosaccharomyces rouxii]